MHKQAFTLAEILIALVIIGVLTAILLPVAFHAGPREDVMKFKKGYNILSTVVRELAMSDKYYKDGDFALLANGVDTQNLPQDEQKKYQTYFCESFADIINTKSVNCYSGSTTSGQNGVLIAPDAINPDVIGHGIETSESAKPVLDNACKRDYVYNYGKEIVTTDGIIFYQENPHVLFHHQTVYGRNSSYKIICMDIDEMNKGEDPFGFGIRADGKMILGARAVEWLEKSIQKENE